MMNRKMIEELNTIAQEDFERASAMLEGINLVMGTKYGWLNKRVVFFDESGTSTCIKYRHTHDAWACAE